MFIEITGKNFNPSDKLEATIEKKFGKLDKYFSSEARAAIMCSEVKTGLCKLEATIYAAGMIFRAERSAEDKEFFSLASRRLAEQVFDIRRVYSVYKDVLDEALSQK